MAVVSVRTDERVLWCVTCDTFLAVDDHNFIHRQDIVAAHQTDCQPVDLRWLGDKRIVAKVTSPPLDPEQKRWR